MFRPICLLIGSLLLASIFFEPTRELWDKLDVGFFIFVNSLLKYESAALLTALLNSRLGDWISHLSFAALLLTAIPRRKEALYSLITLCLIIFLTQFFVNKMLFTKGLHIERLSPSLQVEHFIDIAKSHPLPNNRSISHRSFPADHATTIFLCLSWLVVADKRRWKIPALLALLFILPRLFAGSHGLSDVIAGAGGITLLLFPFLESCQSVLKPTEKKVS